MTLHPLRTTQKALISTTSHCVGEWEQGGVLLALAWPDFRDQSAFVRWAQGPASRSAFVLAFETEPIEEEAGTPLPDYSPTADVICSYLAVLFGKRFDNHGLLEGIGFFHVPDLTQYSAVCDHSLPQNSHAPRADYAVPLNLAEVSRIERLLLDGELDSRFMGTLQGASKFYLQALQNFERNPEVAYLHLITAGEILSGFFDYEEDRLMDQETAQALRYIRESLADGDRVARLLAGQLRRVKKRFVETIVQLVDPDFFQRSEASEPFAGLKADGFRSLVSAAYDLRSRYVHTGKPFGQWVALRPGGMNAEVQVGKPVLEDKELGKIVGRAPTYVGLERIIRYSLLRFAQSNRAYVEPGDGAGGNA